MALVPFGLLRSTNAVWCAYLRGLVTLRKAQDLFDGVIEQKRLASEIAAETGGEPLNDETKALISYLEEHEKAVYY